MTVRQIAVWLGCGWWVGDFCVNALWISPPPRSPFPMCGKHKGHRAQWGKNVFMIVMFLYQLTFKYEITLKRRSLILRSSRSVVCLTRSIFNQIIIFTPPFPFTYWELKAIITCKSQQRWIHQPNVKAAAEVIPRNWSGNNSI